MLPCHCRWLHNPLIPTYPRRYAPVCLHLLQSFSIVDLSSPCSAIILVLLKPLQLGSSSSPLPPFYRYAPKTGSEVSLSLLSSWWPLIMIYRLTWCFPCSSILCFALIFLRLLQASILRSLTVFCKVPEMGCMRWVEEAIIHVFKYSFYHEQRTFQFCLTTIAPQAVQITVIFVLSAHHINVWREQPYLVVR